MDLLHIPKNSTFRHFTEIENKRDLLNNNFNFSIHLAHIKIKLMRKTWLCCDARLKTFTKHDDIHLK